MTKEAKKFEFLLLQNYLNIVKSSVGSKIFRRLYFKINNKKIDILRNGDLSCAFFVSSVLRIFGLISETHATVAGTVKDMKKNGWYKISTPKPGAVIVYAPQKTPPSGETHRHIGFYIGKNTVISNSSRYKSPRRQKWNYRQIEEILWNNELN